MLDAERLAEALRWCLRPEAQQKAREVAAGLHSPYDFPAKTRKNSRGACFLRRQRVVSLM